MDLRVPRFGVPASFVFGLFDEGDLGIGLDDVDPPLDELFVIVGPVAGQLGDGLAAVPLEPRGLDFAASHLAGQHDLEGTLAELDAQ